jgi:predicted amidohydrolase
MFEELRYFSPGDSLEVARTRNGLIGVLICEDLWHLPLPYLLAQQGAQVLVALVASPTRVTGSATQLHIAKANGENHGAFARLLSSYVVFCNRVGFEDGLNFWGASSVTGPDGSVIAECRQFEEDIVVCNISDAEVRRARQSSRHFLDDDPHFFLRELKKIVRDNP